MMMLSAAGCYYGSGMGYGSYANANKIKTTAAADTLEEFKITDFQASDGTFQYKDLGWLSSYQDLEKEIGMPIGTTTAFTEGSDERSKFIVLRGEKADCASKRT